MQEKREQTPRAPDKVVAQAASLLYRRLPTCEGRLAVWQTIALDTIRVALERASRLAVGDTADKALCATEDWPLFGRGMVQPQRGAMFIVMKNQNTSSSVGAAWNQNMPPRWGFVRFTFVFYKHAAPTELPPEHTTPKRTASFRPLTTDY